MGGGSANTIQNAFRGIDDDGGANAGSFLTASNNQNWTQALDVPFRVRFVLQNTGTKDETDGYQLYYSLNGAAYAPISAASSNIKSVASGYVPPPADETATTQRIGAGTFDAGYWDNTGVTSSFTITQAHETELEFCLQLVSADLNNNDKIQLRVYFDGGSALDGYTAGATPELTITIAATGEIANCDVEENDFSDFDDTVVDGGDLSVEAGAALGGTNYGMQFVIDDTNQLHAYKNITHKTSKARARFYIDLNTLAMASADQFTTFYLGQNAQYIIFIDVYSPDGSNFQIKTGAWLDDTSYASSGWYNLSVAEHYVEVLAIQASTPGGADGTTQLWIDGVSQGIQSGIDNFNAFRGINRGYLGATQLDIGTSGTFFLDELIIRDDDTEIGPNVTGNQYYQSASGTFGPAGALELLIGLGLVGSVAPVGVMVRDISANPLGIVGPGGAVVKETATSKLGTLGLSGALAGVRIILQAVSGAIAPAGDLVVQVGKLVAGVISPAGALIKAIAANPLGILGPGGAVVKETATSKLGSLGLSGALGTVKTITRSLAGAIGPGGALSVQVNKLVAGVIAPAGALIKVISALPSGIVGPGGAVVKETATSKLGSVGFSGALVGVRAILQAISGAIGPSGTVTVQVGKVLAGAFGPSGTLAKSIGKALAGVLDLAGTLIGELSGKFYQAVGGVIGPSGAINVQVGKLAAGIAGLAGTVGKAIAAVQAGIVGPGGAVIKQTAASKLGTLDFSGALGGIRTFGRTLAGAISPVGTVSRHIGKGLAGMVDALGAAGKGLTTSLGGILSFSGTVGSTLVGLATGIVNLTLKARSTTLTLVERATGLTLKDRSTDITSKSRS